MYFIVYAEACLLVVLGHFVCSAELSLQPACIPLVKVIKFLKRLRRLLLGGVYCYFMGAWTVIGSVADLLLWTASQAPVLCLSARLAFCCQQTGTM
jgi:hypothetical protein